MDRNSPNHPHGGVWNFPPPRGEMRAQFDFPFHGAPHRLPSGHFGPPRVFHAYSSQAAFQHHVPHIPLQHQQAQEMIVTPNSGMIENLRPVLAELKDEDPKKAAAFENFSDPDQKITILKLKSNSSYCHVCWGFNQLYTDAKYWTNVRLFDDRGRMCEEEKFDMKTVQCKFPLVPGRDYEVVVELVSRLTNKVEATDAKKFRSVFSLSELNALYDLAVQNVGPRPRQEFWYLYRCKPKIYFEDVVTREHSIMSVYVKDANGHAASPINGGIRGLFFSATLLKGGKTFPDSSIFGDTRFVLEQTDKVLHPDHVNYYFADFYCINEGIHYVTVVVSPKGSTYDLYCREKIKQLNPYENPFLMAVKAVDPSTGEIKHRFFVNSSHHRIHIEICITQNIPLSFGTLSDIPTRGKGTAKVGGIRSKVDCTVCNIAKESSFLIDSLHSATPTPQKAESSEPKVEVPQEVGKKRKLAASGEPEVDEKRAKVDASGDAKPAGLQTPLQAALEHDRSNRLTEYVEPTTEVAQIVGHLVEDVGSKEDEEKFLCVDSAEATEEEMAALKRLYEETFGH